MAEHNKSGPQGKPKEMMAVYDVYYVIVYNIIQSYDMSLAKLAALFFGLEALGNPNLPGEASLSAPWYLSAWPQSLEYPGPGMQPKPCRCWCVIQSLSIQP